MNNRTTNAARPKRAADEFSRAQLHDAGEPSSKKARFDARNPSTLADDSAEEDDAILDLDVIGTKGNQIKRNAVELDGYDSDSSNENFDRRAEAKAASEQAAKAKSADEEANDMFADLDDGFADGDDDEDNAKGAKKKKKEVRFLDDNEIEGQVASSKSGGHVSADFSLNGTQQQRGMVSESSSSSDDGGDDDEDEQRDKLEDNMDEELGAGAKKKHAPKLDAFNMKNENEEGRFDDSGNYVRKATDPYAVHDAWLDSSTKSDMKKAREAREKREEDHRKRDLADDAIPTSDILAILITRLADGETVLEALARLGSSKTKKAHAKWQKNKRNQQNRGLDIDMHNSDLPTDPAETGRKEAVEAITAAADQLLTRGQVEIYDAERALLMRQYTRETGEQWVDKAESGAAPDISREQKQWEYRWSDARDGGEHHGPFDGPTMEAWNNAGYFGEDVEFRQIGSDGWARSVTFV